MAGYQLLVTVRNFFPLESVWWTATSSVGQYSAVFPCKLCGKVFKAGSSLSKHKDVHRGITRCPVCNVVLSRASYLKQHLAAVHGVSHSSVETNI